MNDGSKRDPKIFSGPTANQIHLTIWQSLADRDGGPKPMAVLAQCMKPCKRLLFFGSKTRLHFYD